MKWLVSSLFLITIILSSCSEKWIMEVEPKDYKFENKYIQMKWEKFLNLNNCQKVDYLDSVFRPILKERMANNYGSYDLYYHTIDTLLISNNPKKENFYYWIFREVHNITNRRPSTYVTHWSYGGVTNKQSPPSYIYEDSLEYYDEDIKAWKDSLGCE